MGFIYYILALLGLAAVSAIVNAILTAIREGARIGYDKATEPSDTLRKVERDTYNQILRSDTILPPSESNRYLNTQRFGVVFVRFSMLVASADGKVDEQEIQRVFSFFEGADLRYVQSLRSALARDINSPSSIDWEHTKETAKQVFEEANPSGLDVMLLDGLLAIAAADGSVTREEVATIYNIMASVGWEEPRIAFYLNDRLRFATADDEAQETTERQKALRVLGLEEHATDADVRAAHRRMVKEYHPDAVAHMGDQAKQSAHALFLRAQAAYETLSA